MKENKYITPAFITADDLKRIRKKLDITQKEFAALIQVSKPTVERWERSGENITGPVVLLIQMIDKYPEYIDAIKVPQKKLPLRLWYMHRQKVCSIIDVDEMRRQVVVTNYAEHIMFRAFGAVENPSFEMYTEFLESRCFPRTRDKMKLILQDLDLPFYDPFMIIEKTEGRMAEDDFWIRIER
ncbi:MAG: helix-turn-helix domain-containing protein [Ruminococcaceae bacterium]|nr:helix-turn-helix domain-containing protein [Oscillospiraceae bacterium]